MDALSKFKNIPIPTPKPTTFAQNELRLTDDQKASSTAILNEGVDEDTAKYALADALRQDLQQRTKLLATYEGTHPKAVVELDVFLAVHEVHQSELGHLEAFLHTGPDCNTLSKEAQHIYNERQACARAAAAAQRITGRNQPPGATAAGLL